MKKPKNKAKKKKVTQRIDLHSWVTPFGGAKYWEGLIGEVIFLDAAKNATVRFQYKRDGTKMPKIEEFPFALSRLKLVPDFRARIVKHARNAPSQGQASVEDKSLTEIYAEDVIPDAAPPAAG